MATRLQAFALTAATFVVVSSACSNSAEPEFLAPAPPSTSIASLHGDSGQAEALDAIVGLPVSVADLWFPVEASDSRPHR